MNPQSNSEWQREPCDGRPAGVDVEERAGLEDGAEVDAPRVEQFGEEIDGYHFRHRVPVGMTGWAQVNGYWGDTSIETRVRLDNRYIENWSLWRDLVIGLRTIPTLLGKRR